MSHEEIMSDLQSPQENNHLDLVSVVRKPIKGYEGYYSVDQFGRVFSETRTVHVIDNGREYNKLIRGKQMVQHLHSQGYKIVSLTKDGITKNLYVHRLVAEVFIDNPEGLPFVNHKDEDKTNNFVENLEWCTNEYNVNYGTAIERGRLKKLGVLHTSEHKRKISSSLRQYYDNHKSKLIGRESPKKKAVIRIADDGEEVLYPSATEAAKAVGGHQANISTVCRGERKLAYGYRWKYADDYCSRGERRDG